MSITESLPYVKAKYFTPANGRAIRVVVIHDMEAAETNNTAENCANFFATGITTPASAHVCVDNNSAIRSVQDKDVAYHAPGCNSDGLGIEHAGFAAQSHEQWLDDYGQAMLARSADIVADWCHKYNIPAQKLTVAELLSGARGIVGHVDVSNAYHQSNHSDPGSFFPWDQYIPLVQASLQKLGNPVPPNAPAALSDAETAQVKSLQFAVNVTADGIWGSGTDLALRTLRTGDKAGFDVKQLQQICGTVADGVWGNNSKRAFTNTVEKVQRILGVKADGSWGPNTDTAFYALRQKAYKLG